MDLDVLQDEVRESLESDAEATRPREAALIEMGRTAGRLIEAEAAQTQAETDPVKALEARLDALTEGLSDADKTSLWRFATARDFGAEHTEAEKGLPYSYPKEKADEYRRVFKQLQEARKPQV
jgi:hypothetical protein